jgi:predicted Zn-dependent peptidase
MPHSLSNLRNLLAVLLTVLVFSFEPAAPAADIKMPPGLPPYGPMRLPEAPKVKSETLSNGLTVWLVQQNNLPKAAVTLTLRGGYCADPADAQGISDLLAATVKLGTSSMTARQIAERSQAAGGDLKSAASTENLTLSIEPLAEHVSDAIALLAELATHASFPDSEVELAKKNLLSSIQQNESDPKFLAERAFGRIHYGGHPYGVVSPTSAMVEHAGPESLRKLYADTFLPSHAVIVIVGAIDPPAALAAIHASFDNWSAPAGAGTTSAASSEPVAAAEKKVFFVPRPGSVQTALLIGAPAPVRTDPDYSALEVANAIYGGMFGSRLTKNIREDKGYTYSPYSYLDINGKAGVVITREDVRNAVTGPSYKETIFELNRMATAPVSDQELTAAKRYLLGTLGFRLQSRTSVARRLATLWVYGLDTQFIRKDADDIMSATAAQVQQASQRYLAPDKMTVVAVGEDKVVHEQFAPFSLPVVDAPKP